MIDYSWIDGDDKTNTQITVKFNHSFNIESMCYMPKYMVQVEFYIDQFITVQIQSNLRNNYQSANTYIEKLNKQQMIDYHDYDLPT